MKVSTYIVYNFNRMLNSLFKQKIYDTDNSIDLLLKNDISLARYGDGELNIMMGGDIHFQSFDSQLADRLKNLLKNNQNNRLMIGVPLAINSVDGYKKQVKDFWNMNMDTGRIHWFRYCGFKKIFLNASLTRCYIDYEDKTKSKIWFERLMCLWKDKTILIVEGNLSRLGVDNGLFSNAKSIKRILTPANNSWYKYELILEETLKVASGFDLILASIGPTATILAEDVSRKGFRIIDIGHLNLEYNQYIKENKNHIENKILLEEEYSEQIITKII